MHFFSFADMHIFKLPSNQSRNNIHTSQSTSEDKAVHLPQHIAIDIVPNISHHASHADALRKNSGVSCTSGKTETCRS